jgi:copper oxidase (laccase) domain-containing protein
MAHPGDCPCVIIFAKDKKKQPILGLIHLGRQQTDARLAAKAIEYLKKQKILMSDIFVAICPGISQKNYFIPVNKQVKDLPNASMWSNHKEISTIAGEERMYLDLSGYVVEQLLMSGVWAEHIELYDVDTYAAAEKGESFSHRYATVTHNLEKDGRFLLAASLG